MSLATIRTRYNNTKCRVCSVAIPRDELCRYSSRIKGVACMTCEPEPVARTTPVNGTPVTTPTSAADPQLQAALADGRALRMRIGEMEAAARSSARMLDSLRAEVTELRDGLDRAHQAVTSGRVTGAREALAIVANVCAAHPGRDCATWAPHDPVTGVEDAPAEINVLAPGGVERWLERDLAQIAAEKAMKERQEIPAITDDDCPI